MATVQASNDAINAKLPALGAAAKAAATPVTMATDQPAIVVDTELPAAAALADATANPTVPSVGAFMEAYNGTTWDRVRTVNTGQLVTTMKSSGGVEPNIGQYASVDTNGFTSQLLATASHMLAYNGGGAGYYERWRNNTEGTLLASAARTGATSSANQTNYNAKGILVYLNVTAISGTGIYPLIRGIDPISGVVANLNADIANITATGLYILELYPGVSGTSGVSIKQKTSGILPRTYNVTVWHTDASSCTYSVGYSLIL